MKDLRDLEDLTIHDVQPIGSRVRIQVVAHRCSGCGVRVVSFVEGARQRAGAALCRKAKTSTALADMISACKVKRVITPVIRSKLV
jgi:hypothetical protein